MGGMRHDDRRVCLCDRPDGTCAGLAVRRLSPDRVQELAEEIWTASSGFLPPVRALPDPRSSRAGASAQTACRRHREQDRAAWRLGWLGLTWAMAGAALAVGLLIGATVGAWLGWPMAMMAAVLTWSRLRFRPSPEAGIWRRQAAMQRRTAAMLGPLEHEGYLVLHDVTLPGWLDSLDHLLVGPTGVWVIESWQSQRRRPGGGAVPAGILGELWSQTQAIAVALDGWAQVPVQPLLCVHRSRPRTAPTLEGIRVTAPRQLAQVVCSSSPVAPGEVERATSRLLEVLGPAA
jgi:Nuclease-related domain